jgi:hypothetical protein
MANHPLMFMLKIRKFGWLFALIAALSMWFYVEKVLIPYQEADAVLHYRPRGNLSDLYPRWLGARELLLRGRDPYQADGTREIQIGHYGRALDPNRPGDPKDEQRFAYPVFVALLLAPTVKMPFPEVQLVFRWLLIVLTLGSIFSWLRVLGWKPGLNVNATLVFLTMGSYAAVQGIKLQQLSLLVGGVIALSAVLLAGGQLVLAGVVLALASTKPQLVVLLVLWLSIWALSKWRERQSFFWGLFITEACLVAAGEYLLPGWIGRFADAVRAYRHYAGTGSVLEVLTGRSIGMLLNLALVLFAVLVCRRFRRAPTDSPGFQIATAVVLTVTVVIVPMIAPYNEVLLLPAVFLITRSWARIWKMNAASRLVGVIAAVIVFWPWIASLSLMLASIVLPASRVQPAWAMPLWTSPAIPIAVFSLLFFAVKAELVPDSATSL